MLSSLAPCKLERWYSRYGFRARYNLSSSAAPSLSMTQLLDAGGYNARADYLALDLNYGPAEGSPRLRVAIASQYATLGPDDVQVTTGAAEALFLVLAALVRPGDAVIVQAPMYPAIHMLARALDAEVRDWSFGPGGQVDLDHLEALLVRGTVRLVAINHPHSPTGVLLSAGELCSVASLAARHGATLVVDEVYRGIQFAGPVLPPAADLGTHVVSIGDLAKPYGLGGLRVGWIATANISLRKRCSELRDYTSLCGTVPGEYLGAIALEQRTTILAQHLAVARQNRALFAAMMSDVAWMDWRLAEAGFTIFPRSDLPLPTAALCQDLRERYDVLLLPGEVFDQPGYLRLGFGVEPADFEAGLERLVSYGRALYAGDRSRRPGVTPPGAGRS